MRLFNTPSVELLVTQFSCYSNRLNIQHCVFMSYEHCLYYILELCMILRRIIVVIYEEVLVSVGYRTNHISNNNIYCEDFTAQDSSSDGKTKSTLSYHTRWNETATRLMLFTTGLSNSTLVKLLGKAHTRETPYFSWFSPGYCRPFITVASTEFYQR